jgi:cob(I)alamin adenosyltransferase
MKIYTKTGDDGTTGLFGGARIAKDDPRVEAYGAVDELNSVVGLARSAKPSSAIDALLASIQAELFVVGAELATVAGKEDKLSMKLVGQEEAGQLELGIDTFEKGLPPLKSFVLPGGSAVGAALHQARTVCRRAERCVLAASRSTAVRGEVLIYLNRLSDFLFVAARQANQDAGVPDVPWAPRG